MNKEKVGRCETCRWNHVDCYDPSPPGISLSPGQMCEEECWYDGDKWDEMTKKYGDEYMEDAGHEYQCPLWEPVGYAWCQKHRIYHNDGCTYCEEEAWEGREISWKEANGIKEGE